MDEGDSSQRELIGVLFPGIVKNDEKALKCLGGTRGISQMFSSVNAKRLELSFEPDNMFKSKIYGDESNKKGLLVKVRIRKTKSGNTVKKEVLSSNVVGKVVMMVQFSSMANYEYAPIDVKKFGAQCFCKDVIPNGKLHDIDFLQQDNCPLYFPIKYISRADTAFNYRYINKRRAKYRLKIFNSITFNLTDEWPTKPSENIKDLAETVRDDYEIVKKLFDERPIWRMNHVIYLTKIRRHHIQIILPLLGLYHKNGPWVKTYVRYGYDPRKDPEARKYQVLDVRVRIGPVSIVVPSRFRETQCKRLASRMKNVNFSSEILESNIIFKPDTTLTQRQSLFQLCDVHLPEVQELLSVEPPLGMLCHESNGWMPPEFDARCREIIYKYAKANAAASNNADLLFEEDNSEGHSSDDDDSNDEQEDN